MKLDDKHTMSALLKGNCTHNISKLSTMPIEKSIGTLELSVFIKKLFGGIFFQETIFWEDSDTLQQDLYEVTL